MSNLNLIEKIKQKKEFVDLDNKLIKETLEEYFKKHKLNKKIFSNKEEKIIIKEIRARLRIFTGRFQISQKKREDLLNENKVYELLKTHSSTSERLAYYSILKSKINSLKPNSILDLGCGLNPIALASPSIKYYASDIKKDELALIKEYFKKTNIHGRVFIYNLRNPEKKLPKTDICLILKVLDILDDKPSQLARRILNKIQSKYIIISFATVTLSNKPMKQKRRYWLENLLNSLSKEYNIFYLPNEIFYIINSKIK